jgi:phosphate:Na+ symporter
MNWSEIDIWPLLAGLGLFLFGMHMLEEALKNLIGRSFKKFLRKYTTHPIQAVLAGAGVTAILQSSSMVSLLVMSFAGAGIIGLENGIGMIMGANLGTTATGWLVSLLGFKLNIGAAILPFIALGGLGIIFLKSERLSNFSKFLMGFSFMFLGLDYMKNGFAEFATHLDLTFLVGKHGVFFLLVGALLSAAIQSSSAAMMIILSSIAAGMISMEQGFYLVIGSDIGTTITAIIGTVGGNSIRKKVGWSQFTFNFFNAVLALVFFQFYSRFVTDLLGLHEPTVAIVAFHTTLNFVGIIVMLPMIGQFKRLLNKLVKTEEDKHAKYLILANPIESHAAMEALEKEADVFLKKAILVNELYFDRDDKKKLKNELTYFDLKQHEAEVVNFYMLLQEQALVKEEVVKLNHLIASFRNATLSSKDLKDIQHNLDQLRNSASDHLFTFYTEIGENQKRFYAELHILIENFGTATSHDVELLDQLQQGFYQKESTLLTKVHNESKHADIDLPTIMNMLREINNSNESLLRSVRHLIEREL